jgi:predicted acyltransferase
MTPATRYYSLDVFRGATVAFMILVNNPGSWSHLYSPLGHAPWHGLTPTDLVFPFFLFAVGNAMAFVMPGLESKGDAFFWKKVVTRTSLIFLIGILLNWFPFVRWHENELVLKGWTWTTSGGELSGIRIAGVLQRIAICYFFASIIVYYAKPRGALLTSMILLLLYWILCVIGNPVDPYSIEGWFGTAIDKNVFGEAHMYHGEGIAFDPEGIMSTIPAITQVIFGYLVSYHLITGKKSERVTEQNGNNDASPLYKTLTLFFIGATVLLIISYFWGLVFPINKKIWTSSYVLCTTGLAIAILGTLIYYIEIRGMRGGLSRFFAVFGKNPLFIFVLSGLIPKLLSLIRIGNTVDQEGNPVFTTPWRWFYQNVTAKFPGPPENGSLLFAIFFLLLLWAIAYWMDKKKIYIRV